MKGPGWGEGKHTVLKTLPRGQPQALGTPGPGRARPGSLLYQTAESGGPKGTPATVSDP